MIAWHWALAAHILCIVLWVGGMFFALTVLRPSLAALEPAQRVAVHNGVFRRFFLVVWHVMVIAVISGYAMIWAAYGGDFAHLPWNVNAMQAIAWVMVVVFLVLVFGPYRRFRAAASTARAAEALERIRRLILINLILGLITVVIAAIGPAG
ncbi:MAG TPA: CopD family protein [Acetobacteraceae bacterium]|nr:CopD family protein [Acetobacteraceae bacterium]